MCAPFNFLERQRKLALLLDRGSLVHASAPAPIPSEGFSQDSFFYYLTGFQHPHAVFVYLGHKPEGQRSILFFQKPSAQSNQYDGYAWNTSKVLSEFAIDQCYFIDEFWDRIPALLSGTTALYYALGKNAEADVRILHVLKTERFLSRKTGTNCNLPIFDPKVLSSKLRLEKEDEEIQRIRKACSISVEALKSVYLSLREDDTEASIHGKLLYEFLARGADGEAFSSTVASGSNATVLHYRSHSSRLDPDRLLLIDSGARYQGYVCDMTRSFPGLKGTSDSERVLHKLCCKAQEEALAHASLGNTFSGINQAARETLLAGLGEVGILKSVHKAFKGKSILESFVPTPMCHWIGLDVHDLGVTKLEGQEITFAPGMCFAIEPGIYIPTNCDSVKEEFRGIGIRIEDSVLMTSNGPELLTDGIPRNLEQLEELRKHY